MDAEIYALALAPCPCSGVEVGLVPRPRVSTLTLRGGVWGLGSLVNQTYSPAEEYVCFTRLGSRYELVSREPDAFRGRGKCEFRGLQRLV